MEIKKRKAKRKPTLTYEQKRCERLKKETRLRREKKLKAKEKKLLRIAQEKKEAKEQAELERRVKAIARARVVEDQKSKPLAIRKIDLSKCILLKINSKTTIYVKPGANIEAIRAKYTSHCSFP